jgi:hypothetical protein
LRFFHHGQLEGRRIRVPVQLCRAPVEAPDKALSAFYAALLTLLKRKVLCRGVWCLLDCQPVSAEDHSGSQFVAYLWRDQEDGEQVLVVVNYSSAAGRCVVSSWQGTAFSGASLTRLLASQPEGTFHHQAGSLTFELPAWGFEVLGVAV